MSCYAQDCELPSPYELHGEEMCVQHYIEALEHSAHLTTVTLAERESRALPPLQRTLMLARLNERIERRKKRREQLAEELGEAPPADPAPQ